MLKIDSISKNYGALRALRNVSIEFNPGEIHAVLGENGAGKSTLVGIISGFVLPSQGRVTFEGEALPLGKPAECKSRGIEMIHQHFTLVSEFTVEENLALVRLPGLATLVNIGEQAKTALDWAKRLGWTLDPKAKIRDLPVGIKQRIEILKALSGNAKVIVFDEPTAVLSGEEVDDLFRVMRSLRDEGRTIILIAHKLSEVMAIADRITVLRRGEKVATALVGDVTPTILAEWMVGETPPQLPSAISSGSQPEGVLVSGLSIQGDRGELAVDDVSFEVKRGMILGIGGVDGNGQVELAEALVGVRVPTSGSILWESKPIHAGIRVGYVPQDRQSDGLALTMSIIDNMLVTGINRRDLHRGPFLLRSKILEWSKSLMARFSIKADGPSALVRSLSGGNQQKVVVSRTLDETPSLLVVLSPTRGLDIRATQYVRTKILEARDQGAAVVLFSADQEELSALAEQTLFLSRGKLSSGSFAAALSGADH